MNKQINGGPKEGIKGLKKGGRKAGSEEKKRKVRARKKEGEGTEVLDQPQ